MYTMVFEDGEMKYDDVLNAVRNEEANGSALMSNLLFVFHTKFFRTPV